VKLAFSAWAMRDLPIERQCEIVASLGYQGIELVSAPGAAVDPAGLDAAAKRHVRDTIERAGLGLTAIAGHGNLIEPDAAKRAANEAHVRASIDLAAELGAPAMVCMGYGRPESYEVDREQIAEAFRPVAEHAGTRGVTFALEPHVGQAIDLPEKCVWLIEAVGSPHLRLNFDNSHFDCLGRDLDDYVPQLVPYSVHTHLKDQRGIWPQHEFLVPGEGDFDYPRYLRAMAKAGYRGYVTVEISVMIQRRPDYDPAEVAARSYRVLTEAAREAGVSFE
jgi:sugar phosphate isomerase/epimerase